jgi:hypothetical protein
VGHVLSGEGSFVLAAVPDAPSPPANDAAVTNDQRIKVTFGEPLPNARGSPIVGLQLAVDDGAGGEFRTVVGEDEAQATLATAYILEGAEKGKSYRFRCRVQNSIGWSSWSSPDTYIIAAVAPGRPEAPILAQATSSTMRLRFTSPADSGGSPLTQFKLFRNDGSDSNEAETLVASYTSNELSHTLSAATDGLVAGRIYKFRFQAINAIGNSAYSDTVRYALVDPPSAPGTPTVMRALTSTSQLAVEWPKVALTAGQETGQAILGYVAYVMEINEAGGEDSDSATQGDFVEVYNGASNPDTTQVSFQAILGQPIRAGRDYAVKVRARYLNGLTAESPVATIRACSVPRLATGADWTPVLLSTTKTQLTLEWPEPALAPRPVGGCHITSYRLYLSRDDGLTFAEVDAAEVRDKQSLHAHTLDASNFSPADLGKTFLLRLEAITVAGSLSSSSMSAVLADVPAAPTVGPSVDASSSNSTQLQFTVPAISGADTGLTGGSPITSYSLEVDDGAGGSFRALYGEEVNSMSTGYLLREPDMRGRVFRARYRARNARGWSEYSPITQNRAAQRPATPLAAPRLVSATSSEMVLELTRAEDNGGSPITRHELWIDDGALGSFQ